ncbi:hypothetical protein ACWGR4_22285 [Embleya sp. NPDC055664]
MGPPPTLTRDSGLGNIPKRVETLGGICSFGPAPDIGAVLEWRVPLG